MTIPSRVFAVGAVILFTCATALAQDIFLQEQSPASRRYAIFEDDGKTAFLYLTQPGELKPIKDAVAYSRVPPVPKVDWEHIKKTGDTPQLPADIAGPLAVVKSPRPSEFRFQWSVDGQSVAILREGSPLAMATSKDKLGYSKAVAKQSPLGNVWDEKRYRELFGQ